MPNHTADDDVIESALRLARSMKFGTPGIPQETSDGDDTAARPISVPAGAFVVPAAVVAAVGMGDARLGAEYLEREYGAQSLHDWARAADQVRLSRRPGSRGDE